MQRRFKVTSLGTDFTHAVEVKRVFEKQHPDVKFQIRRRKSGLDLVKRVETNEAEKIIASKRPKKHRVRRIHIV
jgi:hypothetical protein